MWLTGFDAPCLHTMYIDKPLKSHNLMQAIARINEGLSNREIETAIRQVVDQALVSATVTNIFDEAGFKTPDLSIVSDEFVAELLGMEHKNLVVELLQKLLKDEVKHRSRTNIVQSRKLAEMLDDALRRYRNQVISVIDVLEELLELAKDTNAANARGEELKLEPYELAFYDALAQNHSAREIMGVDKLRELAIVLVERIRKNASIDWNLKESVRARMKVTVKRLLRQYGYPPDMEARGSSSNGTKNWVKEKLLFNLVFYKKYLSIDHRMLFPGLAIDSNP